MSTKTIPSTRVNEFPVGDRVPFKTHGHFHGEVNESPYPYTGRLDRDLAQILIEDAPDYIVFSYSTPIAWHGKRGWVMPAHKYSVTTSTHQGRIRDALRGEVILSR